MQMEEVKRRVMPMQRCIGLLGLLLAMLFGTPMRANGQGTPIFWIGDQSALWSTGSYWTGGSAPFPGEATVLTSVDPGFTRVITFDSTAYSGIGSLDIQQTANATNVLLVTFPFQVTTYALLEAKSGVIQLSVQSSSVTLGDSLTLSNAVGAHTILTMNSLASMFVTNNINVIGGVVTNAGAVNIYNGGIYMTNAASWTQLGGSIFAGTLTNAPGSAFRMSGGSVTFTNIADNEGTFVLTGGTNSAYQFINGTNGSMTQGGGEMDASFVVNYGTWTITNGVANLSNFVAGGGINFPGLGLSYPGLGTSSVLNVFGGRLNVVNLNNGWTVPSTININSNGFMTVRNNGSVASYSTGVINVTTGVLVFINTPILAEFTNGNGTLNINAGGIVVAPGITNGNGTGTIDFNGGTFQFSTNVSFGGYSNLFMGNGGATLDVSNYTVTLAQPFTAFPGGSTGGMTKAGAGTLILAITNTYSGPTIINNGSLLIGDTNLIGTNALIIGAGGSIGLTNLLTQTFLDWLNTRLASPLAGAVVTPVNDDSNLLFYGNLANAFLGAAGSNAVVYTGNATWTNSSTLRFGGGSGWLIYPYAISPVTGDSNLIVGPVGGDSMSIVQLNSPASIYAGGTIVNSGTLRLGNRLVLGNPTGTVYVTINPGGALDLNGWDISGLSQTVMISGMGIGPQAGALYNSGPNLVNLGVRNVTLAGDAAIGGPGGRMDILGVLNGASHNLYKVGSNQTFIASAGYITNVPTIVVNGGLFGIQGAGQMAGAGATVIQVYTGGTFGVFGNLTFTNALQLYGGTLQDNGPAGGITTWNGPVTLNGVTNYFDSGTALGMYIYVNGSISGAGILEKVNGNTVILGGSNSYTGGTII